MKKFDAYQYGKEQGYIARDVVECLMNAAIARIFVEHGIKLSKGQEDAFTEGFWNGVV